jgi:hypothetical protein
MGLSLQHLLQYANDGEDMLNRIVTGDESLPTRIKVWFNPIETSQFTFNKKFKVAPSAGKVMLTVFWDSQGVLLAHFQKGGVNGNSALHCEVLLKLRDANHRKHPGQLARGVLLHHDSARPHTA